MKTLISNTAFGDYVNSITMSPSKYKQLRDAYDSFLKQPLQLGMFVPCDLDGNVLEEPEYYEKWMSGKAIAFPIGANDIVESYNEAKERVLFNGFVISENNGNIILTNGRNSILFSIRNWVKHIESNERITSIEDLSKLGLTLTPTALKQIGV